MKNRYLIWYGIILTLHLFCWYYAVVFCSLYKNASKGWFIGCIISTCMDLFAIQLISPIIHSVLRSLIKAYPRE
jgi:hypothetical protein